MPGARRRPGGTVILVPVLPLIIVVDDVRSFPAYGAHGEMRYARSAEEAVALLAACAERHETIATLLLDHDLGTTSTGVAIDVRPVVRYLLERCASGAPVGIEEVIVHSANPVGARYVAESLSRWYSVRRADASALGAVVPTED